MRHTAISLALGLVGGTALLAAPRMPAAHAADALPIATVEGAMIDVAGQRWVLSGLDVPLIASARCAEERDQGLRAKARLDQLTGPGRSVLAATDGSRDWLGRIQGRLFVDGQDVAPVLVNDGLARVLQTSGAGTWCLSSDARQEVAPPPAVVVSPQPKTARPATTGSIGSPNPTGSNKPTEKQPVPRKTATTAANTCEGTSETTCRVMADCRWVEPAWLDFTSKGDCRAK
jgi:Staphylococcal nuclease homologue